METKTNRHVPENINQQEATRAAIVSKLRAGLTVKEIMSIKTSKEALFKTQLKEARRFFCFWRICWNKKGEQEAQRLHTMIVLAARPEELITRDHGKSMRRTSLRCGRRRLPARLTAALWTILCGAFLSNRSMQSLTTKSRTRWRRWRCWWGP